jgi:hypothetical protein
MYAAKAPTATFAQVQQRGCDETGFADYGAPCATGLAVTCSACPSSGSDVTVGVTYQFDLVSGYLFQQLLGRGTLTARGSATFRSLTQ